MSTAQLLERALEAKAKDVEKKPTRSRMLGCRVVEEVYLAFVAIAKEKGYKPAELHRKILYAFIDQQHRKQQG